MCTDQSLVNFEINDLLLIMMYDVHVIYIVICCLCHYLVHDDNLLNIFVGLVLFNQMLVTEIYVYWSHACEDCLFRVLYVRISVWTFSFKPLNPFSYPRDWLTFVICTERASNPLQCYRALGLDSFFCERIPITATYITNFTVISCSL